MPASRSKSSRPCSDAPLDRAALKPAYFDTGELLSHCRIDRALRAGTISAARFIALEQDIGLIEVGKLVLRQ